MLAAALVAVSAPGARAAKLEEGQQGIAFKGADFLSGAALDVGQSLGKRVILLDFGSIYCSSCMVTVPNLIKLRKQYPEEDLAIFNIYLDIYNPQRVVKFFRGFAGDMKLNLRLIGLRTAAIPQRCNGVLQRILRFCGLLSDGDITFDHVPGDPAAARLTPLFVRNCAQRQA